MKLPNIFSQNLKLFMYSFSILVCMGCSSTTETIDEEEGDEIEIVEEEQPEEEEEPETTDYDITSILTIFTSVMDDGLSNYSIGNKYVTITTQDLPDHKSPYYEGTEWEEDMYEENTASGFRKNPGSIGAGNIVFNIPINPVSATVKEETPMGPMGIARNGVLIFNQYAAGRSELNNEIQSFDQYSGHPASTTYHYHIEPLALTEEYGEEAILGLLLDGFPLYGPIEDGVALTSEELDDYHGHFKATKEFPNGIYHYHVTATDPYINGDGFYGEVGTIAR